MFVLDWTAYPFICLSVALPMAVLYLIERRRELKAEAAYDGPCMAHVGTDTDGTELWCWQKSGHSGAHDDYDRSTAEWLADMALKINDNALPIPVWAPATDHDGNVIGFATPEDPPQHDGQI